jgi:hypothetical protein
LKKVKIIYVLLLIPLLSGCSGAEKTAAAMLNDTSGKNSIYVEAQGDYTPPPFADSVFHEDLADGNERVRIDMSAVSEGYVAVSARSEKRLKFQTIFGDVVYNYDISSDGKASIFPLQSGSGSYRFRVMENTSDSRYTEVYAVGCSVELRDEFQPFLRPNDYVPYKEDSACVKKAKALAETADDARGFIAAVYDFVSANVAYDREKAETVQPGYLPDPDETLLTGKGICLDRAALAAAMLRSQGVPTKLVFGYVLPDESYHAWNRCYTQQTGWVTVSFERKKDAQDSLFRLFAADGIDDPFISDDSNYAELYSF